VGCAMLERGFYAAVMALGAAHWAAGWWAVWACLAP